MKLRKRIITIGMAAMMLGGTVTTASILPSTVITSTVSAATTYYAYGSKGDGVRELQRKLNQLGYNLDVDGSFGPATKSAVLSFQRAYGLTQDGSAGPQTLAALEKAVANKKSTNTTTNKTSTSTTTYYAYGSKGDGVRELQRKLNQLGYNLDVDGSFGPATKSAVLSFQRAYGLTQDGSAGPQTLATLEKAVANKKSNNTTANKTSTSTTTNIPLSKAYLMDGKTYSKQKTQKGITLANINGKWYTKDNPFYRAGYKGQCTWYAWGRFYEVHGIKLNSTGHAKSFAKEKNSKAKYISGINNIREKSLAVRTSGNYGHVMFIEYVQRDKKGNPTYVYVTQANYDANGKYNSGIDGRLEKFSWKYFKSSRNPAGYIVKK